MTDEEVRQIRIVKSDNDKIAGATAAVVWLLFLYYWSNPTAFDKVVSYVRARWQRWQYLVSVWQAQRAIETLPETNDPEM